MDANAVAKSLVIIGEAQHATNDAIADALESIVRLIEQHDEEMAELRDEVHALANRVESLTRAELRRTPGHDTFPYSVKVPE